MKLSQTGTSNSLNIPVQRTFSTNPQEKSSPRLHYHDLMETLGVVKSASGKRLPTSLKELKDIPKTERKILPELGPPTGRKDAQMLIIWLDSMLAKVATKNESLEGMLESALSIYETCFHEIVRQVSVHCKERGELINRVWKANISLLERALRISQSSQQTQYQQFRQEKENIKAVAAAEAIRLRSEIEENKLSLLNYADKLTNKEEDIIKLGTLNKRLVHRLEIIRGHYESVKKDIVNLREENRILKAKLVNTETEFVVNDHGVIEAQYKRQKIKRKSKGMLEQIATDDPIIQAGNHIDINQHENLTHEIVTHENELAELFKKVDFQDEGTDAPVVKLEDKEIQTDVEDLCGENYGESKDKIDPTPIIIDLIDLQLQSMSQSGLDNTELCRQKSIKQQILDDIFKHNEEMSRFQHLLDKMKEGSGFTTPIMSTLYSSMNNVLKESKNSETRPEIKRLKTIRKRLWTVIQASRMKKASEIPLVLIHKVKTTPQHKLKRILVKKILLKFIMMLYDSKLQKRVSDPDSKKFEWAQIVFEVLSNKYGPGKIAESKFIQLTSSVIKYKHIKRVKVFGRFLKLFDDFDNDDLDFYLDMILFFKNSSGKEFSNVEYSDQVLVSYEKAMDLFKSNYLQKLTEAERKSVKMWIDSNKFMDSLYKTQVIDQDGFLEFIIEKNRSKKYARVNFLKCIYEAADVISI